jgi:hypothetical protein
VAELGTAHLFNDDSLTEVFVFPSIQVWTAKTRRLGVCSVEACEV